MPLDTQTSYPKWLYCWNAAATKVHGAATRSHTVATTHLLPLFIAAAAADALAPYIIERYLAFSKHNVM